MSDTEATLEVLKSLVVLRRALRSHPPSDETKPRLPVAQVQVLLHLAQFGPMTMSILAGQLGVSCPAATDLVDRLVAADRVERAVGVKDRRQVMVQLTPAAQEMAQGALAARREKVAGVLDVLSDCERTGFVRGLQLLANGLAAGAGLMLMNAPTFTQEAAVLASMP